jgi:adenylate cyclase
VDGGEGWIPRWHRGKIKHNSEPVEPNGARESPGKGCPFVLNAALVNRHLDEALRSPLFRKAGRQSRFLRFVVDAALRSPEATIKEFDIGMAVYDRSPDYDPSTDPIVRVEAARLRARLREYYEGTPPEAVRIDIPKGHYVPTFISVGNASAQLPSDLSILVLPFRNLSSEAADQNFCDGLTEEVLQKLAQEPQLRLLTQSAAAWIEPGERPKPRFLLEASVRRAAGVIRLTLLLTDLSDGGSGRFSKVYQSTMTDVFATQERLAEEIHADVSAALHIAKKA